MRFWVIGFSLDEGGSSQTIGIWSLHFMYRHLKKPSLSIGMPIGQLIVKMVADWRSENRKGSCGCLQAVQERLLPVDVRESKILLQSQHGASFFLCHSPFSILRKRSLFRTRRSSRGIAVFLSQTEQINDNFGMAAFTSSSFQFAFSKYRYSSKLCLFFQ
jgi:hypothetical protein